MAEQVGGDSDLLGRAVDQLGHGTVADQMRRTCLPKACLVWVSICCRIAALRMGRPYQFEPEMTPDAATALPRCNSMQQGVRGPEASHRCTSVSSGGTAATYGRPVLVSAAVLATPASTSRSWVQSTKGLLEYHPHVDREQRRFDLVAGSERKQTGSHHTPPALVMELIDVALVPVMEERLAKATTPEAKDRALLDLKVVDPAAGSGHFLLAAAARIGKELARVRTGEPELVPRPSAPRSATWSATASTRSTATRSRSTSARSRSEIEGHNTGRPLSFLDHHVKLGDSLIGVFDLKVLEKGVPDDAYKPLTGDDEGFGATAQEAERRRAEEKRSVPVPRCRGPRVNRTQVRSPRRTRRTEPRRRRRQAGALRAAAQRARLGPAPRGL